MYEFEKPVYAFDFRDNVNCSKVENAVPGKEIRILVHDADDDLSSPLPATGVLDEEGMFNITIKTDAGVQKHAWPYGTLLDAINAHRKT